MKITIKDVSICEQCNHKTCAISDVVDRLLFARFRTERYVCPVRYLKTAPTPEQLESGRIDIVCKSDESTERCFHCGLCALKCSNTNLSIDDDGGDLFGEYIENCGAQNEGAANILATSYLDLLFDFSANTNLNKSMLFDGIVCDSKGNCAFVETDGADDSLESCRRLLSDLIQHNFKNPDTKIKSGIMVLKSLPKSGSRDVYTLSQKMSQFPGTSAYSIYVVTFEILRALARVCNKGQLGYADILFAIARESVDDYKKRVEQLTGVTIKC